MLKLSKITKQYRVGGNTVDALRGVDLEFRENEFVSILGPSGCGKTTTLNIIGGLDRYTSGDLIINGRSTKEYKDSDWDAYRNHSIGFVFQSYNLISHQTVLANVELALTLAGVSRSERRRRAVEALRAVGLGDQLDKLPSQMSGGQMQRVAIARALINDPDILLADEPTGALDSETSVQVMELLKEVARDRLVIMVTHNPELAQTYSTRIVRLKDGVVTGDSNPYHAEETTPVLTGKQARTGKKTSMSFLTALSLSLTNLRTKLGRTVLTAFAGSIGIIGIALILALSTGINNYINQVQEDTLSSYPITIQAETTDVSSLLAGFMEDRQQAWSEERDPDRVYASTVMFDLMDSMVNAEVQTNDLEPFKKWLDNGGGGIKDMAAIHYGYDFDFDIYTTDEDGKIIKCDVMSLMESAMGSMFGGDYSSYFSSSMGAMYSGMDVWNELLPGDGDEPVDEQAKSQYELLYGGWPENYDEVILFVNPNNEISDLMLYALGLIPSDEMEETMNAMMNGEEVGTDTRSWTYSELAGINFKLILPAEYYQYDAATGGYTDMSATDTGMDYLFHSGDVGLPLKVVGVARPAEGANARSTGSIGYTAALTAWAIENSVSTDILKAQLDDPDTDVFTALPFPTEDDAEPTPAEKAKAIAEHLSGLPVAEKALAYIDVMGQPSQEYIDGVVEERMDGMTRESIEEMIVEQYASEMGVDGETITSYIADMDDETLFARVEEAISDAVTEQYSAAVEAQLGALTNEQLAELLDQALEDALAEGPEDGSGEASAAAPLHFTAPAPAGMTAVPLNAVNLPQVMPLSALTAPAPGGSASPETSPAPGESASPEASPAPGESASPEASPAPGGSAAPETSPIPGESASPEASPAPGGSAAPEASPAPGESASPEASPAPGEPASPETSPAPGESAPPSGLPGGIPGDWSGGIPGGQSGAAPGGWSGTIPEGWSGTIPQDWSGMAGGQIPGTSGAGGQMPDLSGMGGQTPGMAQTGEPFEEWQLVYLYDNYMPPTVSDSTYEENLDILGYVRPEVPSEISIYATTFAEKDEIADLIAEYNAGVDEEQQITYTDYVALLMSSITDIISGISYLLIAFVSISLVVSSIMIGIITNISVLERTKEIGILRAVGASKRDVSRVFNAETLIVGLAAGLLGILVSFLATFPINYVIHSLTDLNDLVAELPAAGAAILIAISVLLTVFAGLVPARSAAKKDPVEALRSE